LGDPVHLLRSQNKKNQLSIRPEITTDLERQRVFLRNINFAWLLFGIVTLVTMPFYTRERLEFIFLITLIFPTFLITHLLNIAGRWRLAGTVFSLAVNFCFLGLFIVLVGELGAFKAFETETPALMLIGLAVLFAGAFVDKWAAPILAGLNSIVVIGTQHLIAPGSEPRPSILVFWWMMALTIWLYEGTLSEALRRSQAEAMVRKQAEDELKQSEERHRLLIEEARDVIFTISSEGRITSLNPSFETFIGWPRADWIGRSFKDLVAEGSRAQASEQFERILKGETLRALRLRMVTRTKKQLVVEMNISPQVKDGNVIGLLGIARDMTEEQKAEDLLMTSEKRFRALIENSSDAISLSNAEGLITYASPSIVRMLGYTPEERLGRDGSELFHPEDLEVILPQYKDILQHPDKTVTVQYRLKHKDGSWRWIEAVVRNMFADPNVGALVSNYRDITERKNAEIELKRYAQNNATMTELSHQILTRLNLDQVYESTRQAVQKMMSCDAFVIALLDEATQEINEVYLWDHDKRWPGIRHPFGEGLTDYIISSGRSLLVNEWDESHSRSTHVNVFGLTEQDSRSVLAVPLIETSGRCIGMISAQSYSPDAYKEEDQRLLVTLANQVSEAIKNTQLFDELQRSNLELTLAYDATIEGWSRAMDLRDKETEGHTQRVTELTLSLAKAVGINDEELTHIRRGALLHDIGKLGVPDEILYKNENLSEAEWMIMHKHPLFAHQMLSSIPYLEPALVIPYCHHEKWDGSGYPRGLKGEEIPVEARIFALADVWDALTSDRPYRPAWTKDKSLQYIKDQSGKYFDPKFVQPFLNLIAADS
jgi:PAS domain S-box-containing protein